MMTVVTGVLAWWAARRAAEAAAAMTEIEKRRLQRETRPEIQITLTTAGQRGHLEFLLTGPQGIEQVRVTLLEIQDTRPWTNPVTNIKLEDLTPHVRGPYQFDGGLKGQTEGGRTVEPFTLTIGYKHVCALGRTSPPPALEVTPAAWAADNHGLPIRLKLTCTQPGFEPWDYIREADVQP
jgi:hypothetical protein